MSSGRKRKAPPLSPETPPPAQPGGRQRRRCDRRGCDTFSSFPFCFVHSTERCAGDGHTSRWHHLSAGQHFCNECFEYFYRSNKPGNSVYNNWCTLWEKEGGDRVPPGAKMFIVDQYLPVWVQCTIQGCGRWRKLPPNIELHHVKQNIVRCSDCSRPEDEVVSLVTQSDWISTVCYTPMLRYSTLAPLLSEYFPDGVGISPVTVRHCRLREVKEEGGHQQEEAQPLDKAHLPSILLHPLHPFNHPHEGPRAQAFTPDVMEPLEIRAFPEFYRVYETQGKWHCPRLEVYCLMRNLILGLWFQNYKEYLTEHSCIQALSLRGLLRIWCAQELPRVLHFLTAHGIVNHGFLTNMPRPLPFPRTPKKAKVLVIGAGAAGICAANHLCNYGHTVHVLEATSRIGGRIKDDFSLGPCVGLGAMFITGVCNNPFTLLSQQVGTPLRIVDEDHCDLVTEWGQRSDREADNKVERHFNETLDLLSNWRHGQSTDQPLEAKLNELNRSVLDREQPGLTYSTEERGLLDFHYSNLEFACGAPLNKVSSLHWDHNDSFPQFTGSHAILPSGHQSLLAHLAKGLDITFGAIVTSVEVLRESEGGRVTVRVTDAQGRQWIADKVIITVPLSVLKKKSIVFSPPLPDNKKKAISQLGAGLVEKVALKFPVPFWRKMVGACDFFGHVTTDHTHRGMFGMFYDMSTVWTADNIDATYTTNATSNTDMTNTADAVDTTSKVNTSSTSDVTNTVDTTDVTDATNADPIKLGLGSDKVYILLATVSGEALQEYQLLTDSQIVERCVSVLRKMFGAEAVPPVLGHLVTRWGTEPHAGMSYSYVAVGSSGADYDVIAKSVDDVIFFAGEATNRQHPQTVTGAYLSGIREACKIMDCL